MIASTRLVRHTMKRVLVKAVLFIAALAVIGWVFWRSVQTTRSADYVIEPAHLIGWMLAIEPGSDPHAPLIVLRPPRDVAGTLFRQLFTRLAESFNGPAYPTVPVILREEFTRSFGDVGAETLIDAARGAGLEAAPFVPQCMGHRRESAPGVTRQVYFVVFNAPAFGRFREAIAARAAPNTGYAPAALSPIMIVAATEPDFHRWLPIRVNPDTDCVAPISVESTG